MTTVPLFQAHSETKSLHTFQSVNVFLQMHWMHIAYGVKLETCTDLGVSKVWNESKICDREPRLAF